MTAPREAPPDSQNGGRAALRLRPSDAVDAVRRSPLLLEQSRSRAGAIAFGLLSGLLVAYLAWLLVRGPQALQLGVTNGWIGTAFRLAAGVVCLVFGLRRRRGSYIPLVFGVALIFTAIGNTILTVDSLHGPPPPPPTPADFFGLGFIVLCFAGIGLMAQEDRQRLSPRGLLDAGIAALGAGAVGAAFALAHIARIPGESSVGAAFQLADAIGFVVLVLLAVGAAAVVGRQSQLPWIALTVAFALLAVGSGLGAALGMTVAVRTLTTIQWPAATLLIAAAVWVDPGAPDPLAVRRGIAVWIPALACGAAIAVLFAATLTPVDHTATALAAGALLLVMARGYSELRHEIGTRQRTERSLRESEAGYRRVADEQAALRRVATLVARGVPAPEVFDAVASETQRIFEFDTATLLRLEPDGTVTVAASVATMPLLTATGDRRPPLGGGVVDRVVRTGLPARIDGFEGKPGSPGGQLNALGYGGAAAAPISVASRLWGVLRVAWSKERSVSPGSEDRLLQFSELIATALANTEAREELRRVADEQAALRRVATLVAEAAPPSAIFESVAEEVRRLLLAEGAFVVRYASNDTVAVLAGSTTGDRPLPIGLRTPSRRAEPGLGGTRDGSPGSRRPLRRAPGRASIRHQVLRGGADHRPGRVYGATSASHRHARSRHHGTEVRLAAFTEIVATAIANAEAREELRTVADEQVALRRVATLVAQGEAPTVVFDAVAEQVGQLLNTDDAVVVRFEPDQSVTIVASWTSTGEPLPIRHRRQVEPGDGLTSHVRETGRSARIDSQTAETAVESAVAAPITVEGRIWGVVGVALRGREPAPSDTEARLSAFTGLVATAIANAESRAELTASRARIVTAADEERRVSTRPA